MKLLIISLVYLVSLIFVQADYYLGRESLTECYNDLGVPLNNNGVPLNYSNINANCIWSCLNFRIHVNSTTGKLNDNNYAPFVEGIMILCNEATMDEEDLCTRAILFSNCYSRGILKKEKQIQKDCSLETNTHHTKLYMDLYNFKNACYNRCVLINYGKLDKNNKLEYKEIAREVNNGTIANNIYRKCNKQYNKNDECLQAIYRALCVRKERNKVYRLQFAHNQKVF